MAVLVSILIAALAVGVSTVVAVMSRHSAARYKRENEDENAQRHLNQQLVFMEILGLPGNPDWPSLKQRLQRIHDRQEIVDERTGRIEINVHDMQKELHPNGGGSMRDEVTMMHIILDAIAREVTTENGITLAELADRMEARRILQTTVPTHRTAQERSYVENLRSGGTEPRTPAEKDQAAEGTASTD